MEIYQLLSAVGPDRPGIVATLTEILFKHGCNLEDSAMMRLGSEFGVQLIFTSRRPLLESIFSDVKKRFGLTLQLKTISKKLASSKRLSGPSARVVLHGFDRPGIVYQATRVLAEQKFNITDLATHRTSHGRKSGYLLFIEGNLHASGSFKSLQKKLDALAKRLKVTIRLNSVSTATF
jgi:glycine cleavage system transcriptional repressor